MSERLFKWLNKKGLSPIQGWQWPLPNGKPTNWLAPVEGELESCWNGYHLCREVDLLDWASDHLYLAEARGDRINSDNKICVREARLIERVGTIDDVTFRLFAADCAEYALHLFEREYPDDKRPREAIEAARRFALGEIDDAARDAAWDAAWAAARAAARDAARAAARAAAWDAARDAAWDAARAAARAAARDAAWDAAWDAARALFNKRLLQYVEHGIEAKDMEWPEAEG